MPSDTAVLAAVIASAAAVFTLVTAWVFNLFPSTHGAGQRFWGWICTYGLLWPLNRVVRAGALDRLIGQSRPQGNANSSEVHLKAALEMWALLAPVMERHPKWFVHVDIDANGVEHRHRRRFVELRIRWCLLWRGESFVKFQRRFNDMTQFM